MKIPHYVEINELDINECFLTDHDFAHETPTLWKVVSKAWVTVEAEIVKVGSDSWRSHQEGFKRSFDMNYMCIPSTKTV